MRHLFPLQYEPVVVVGLDQDSDRAVRRKVQAIRCKIIPGSRWPFPARVRYADARLLLSWQFGRSASRSWTFEAGRYRNSHHSLVAFGIPIPCPRARRSKTVTPAR